MSKYVMPCLGDFDGDSYACVDGCSCPEECLMLIPVAALPELLSHPDLQVQQLAKSELERAISAKEKECKVKQQELKNE